MDTQWADVSEYQPPVTDAYPYQVLCIRANDGTYRDKTFAANYKWACDALNAGKLKALIVYCVYRSNWEQTLATTKAAVGIPHPHMAVMIDVESWGGQITGNQSSPINELYWGLADWLGNPLRVIGYGNTGDLNSLWRDKPPGMRLVVAAYGSNPDYPGKIAHQYADNQDTPPFGPCDINSADGMGVDELCAALGLQPSSPPLPPGPQPTPGPDSIPTMQFGQTSDAIRHLQQWTNQMYESYSQLPVTGLYGPMTQAVIAEFQRREGIVGGDGYNVGPQTKAALWAAGYRP